jgi:hypothetical protein
LPSGSAQLANSKLKCDFCCRGFKGTALGEPVRLFGHVRESEQSGKRHAELVHASALLDIQKFITGPTP